MASGKSASPLSQLLALVLIALLGMASPALGQNLVANGGFESGFNSGWNHLANNNGASATFSEETASPYVGAKALKAVVATLGTNAWDVQSLGPTVSLTTGASYRLTYWAKANAAGKDLRMVVQGSNYLSQTKTLGTTWAKYTWDFTAAEASPSVRMNYLQTGTFWVDDIQIVSLSPGNQITVSPGTKYQTMDGFGAALSWNIEKVYKGDAANDAALEELMFNDSGLDIIRLKNWYYPTNYPTDKVGTGGAFTTTQNLFAAAKAINPEIKVLLSSWSPPANLKSNNERTNGGTLKKNAGAFMYDEFAQYWVDCLDNLGWTPDYLSFQNEPGYTATWESCIFTPSETAGSAGYAEAADAIWNAIKDRPNVPKMVGSEAENMPAFTTLNAPLLTRPYFDVHGYHIYDIGNAAAIDSGTTLGRLRNIRDNFGDRPNWMTEYSNGQGWLDSARVIHNTIVEANASAYIYWKLMWGDDAASTDEMISVDPNGAFTVEPHYYAVKHYSKHVNKGYRRIAVSGAAANVKVSGFLSKNHDSITLVAINNGTSATPFQLANSGLSISSIQGYQSVDGNFYQTMNGLNAANPVNLPAKSLTTFVLTLSSPLNSAPSFLSNPVIASNAAEGTPYSGTLVGNASDLDNDPLSFAKVSGPPWLNVAANGVLTGTPAGSDIGINDFTVSVSDGNFPAVQAILRISVAAVFNAYVAKAAFGVSPENQGFNSDPDGDGVANGLEFVFGTHPGVPNTGIYMVNAVNTTTMSFTHPKNTDPTVGVALFYQWSSNLVDWYLGNGIDGPGGGPTMTINSETTGAVTTVTATATQAVGRMFIRVGASQD